MKRIGSILLAALLIALLLLPLGCNKESKPGSEQSASDSVSVLARTVTVNGTEMPNAFAWYYHMQDDGTAMIDRYVCVTKSEMTLPEKVDGHPVTALGRNTFRDEDLGVSADTVITIPDCITTVEGNPFDTHGYFSISVSDTHPTLTIKNGALYDKRQDRLIYGFRNPEETVTMELRIAGKDDTYTSTEGVWIPEGTKIIEDHAFRNVMIGHVTIPASVEAIGQNPFGYRQSQQFASMFTGITVAEGNPYFKVHDGALFDERDHRLISASRYDYLEIAQSGDPYTIPDGTKMIDDLALACVSMRAVTIPASVEKIGAFPFSTMTEITLAPGNARFASTGGVLYDRTEKRVICRVHDAYADQEAITIPEDAEIIGVSALQYLSQDLTLPDSVREIEAYAIFGKGGSYEDAPVLRIPKTVRRFGMNAIRNCRLENDRLELTGGVTIGSDAFSEALYLTDVSIGDGGAILYSGAFHVGYNADSSPLKRFSVGTGETVIGRGAFSLCTVLSEVNLSEGVALIGEQAFYECHLLTELKLPKSLFWTSEGAFMNSSYEELTEGPSGRAAYKRVDQCTIAFIVYHDSFGERFVKSLDPEKMMTGTVQYRYAD